MAQSISNLSCHSFCTVLLENLNQGVYFVDSKNKIIYWNAKAEKITGYKSEEVLGKSCSDNVLVHINDEGKICCGNPEYCPVAKVAISRKPYENDLYIKHKEGYRILVHIKTIPVFDENQNMVGVAEIFYDNSEMDDLKLKIQELEKLALIDSLTKIANRRYIELQLRSRLNEFKRFGWQFGLLFIDIDHFKQINDKYGHDTGDRVLKMVAQVLIRNSRSFDLAGRWGGEEFIVIAPNVNDTQLYTIAHKFKNLIALSNLRVNSEIINVTVSVGATLVKANDTLKSIIKRADKLMYHSKQNGRNKVTTDFEIS
ncbi:MAG: sensor domain-containing diguanylate cyclase [candidate division WOR-3 bacterium]|nr:sensor domain-containing diguanylate cyclase [candidate division WOR-3 bacterium]